jgi:DNA polymerase II large subunit
MKNGPYTLVVAPEDYPGKKYRDRYVYEHHLVWWKNTGEVLNTETHLIHHENENKRDNRFENLSKMGKGPHSSHHARPQEMVDLTCDWCGERFRRDARSHRSRKKQGYQHSFCSGSHQVKYQWKHQGQKGKIFWSG